LVLIKQIELGSCRLPNGLFRALVLLILFSPLAAAQTPAQTPALEVDLRLDTTLDAAPDSGMTPVDERLNAFGLSDLRRRVTGAQQDLEHLARTRNLTAKQLQQRERLIAELQNLVAAQDGTLQALEKGLAVKRMHAEAEATGTLAARQPTGGPPQAAESPTNTKQPLTGEIARVDPAPWQSGANELPFGLDKRLVVELALAVAVLGLLAWGLSMRRRIRSTRLHQQESQARALEQITEKATAVPASGPAENRSAVQAEDSLPIAVNPLRTTRIEMSELLPEARFGGGEDPDSSSDDGRGGHAGVEGAEQAVDFEVAADSGGRQSLGLPADGEAERGAAASAAVDWSQSAVRRRAADPTAMREVDALTAFEDFDHAARLLRELVKNAPENPEYRLRLLHVETELGNTEAAATHEEFLSTMMDGPLSDTLGRVKDLGKVLLPGHPLFENEGVSADVSGGAHAPFSPSHPDTIKVSVTEQSSRSTNPDQGQASAPDLGHSSDAAGAPDPDGATRTG
jgi:hypothetical protein